MVSKKEYFLLSILSYCNFTEKDFGKNLLEVFKKNSIDKYHLARFKALSKAHANFFIKYFKNELESWELFAIENNRATREERGGKRTGFYGVSFKKENYSQEKDSQNTNSQENNSRPEYVIAFRGSESIPYEEAYKDFIETNLLIGMGKRPEQFNDAVNFFNKHIYLFGVKKESISITGHSLGGGIAQYLAAYCDFYWDYIPLTYTWNGVGLKSFQLFAMDDFINLEDILKKIDKSPEIKLCLLGLKDDFFKYFQDNIFNDKQITDKKSVEDLIESYRNIGLKLELSVRFILGKVRMSSSEVISIKDKCLDCFLEVEELKTYLNKVKLFFQDLKNNNKYDDYVINYGHSKDITFNLYQHIGSSYDVDRAFKKKNNRTLGDLLSVKENIFMDFHLEDVFLPYFSESNGTDSTFSEVLNFDYVASFIRSYIYKEDGFSKNILKLYYTLEHDKLDPIFIRKELISGLKKSKLDTLYKNNGVIYLSEITNENIIDIWTRARNKMSSPFEFIDIFDIFLY